MTKTVLLFATILSSVACDLTAQVVVSTQRDRGITTANKSEYSINYGPTDRRPRDYDYWYYNNRTPYVLSPYVMVVPPQVKQPLPAMPRISDVDYGKFVEQAVNASVVQPAGARSSVPSVVDKAGATTTDKAQNMIEAHVVDVLDRGLMVLDSYDEVKLRGVDMASENEIDDVNRYYARQGIDTLRRLVMNGPVYIQLGTPERSSDGPVLADVFLADGTLVNRQIMELGLGHFDAKDFAPDQISVTLQAAEQRARNAKVGLFSKE